MVAMDFRVSLEKHFGSENAESIYREVTTGKLTHALIINPKKISDEAFLKAYPDVKRHPFVPHAFLYEKEKYDFGKKIIYDAGAISIQDAAAMMAVYFLNPQKEDTILDMCAAPGGKTSQMVALSGGEAHLTACEMNGPRAEKLEYNLAKLGCRNVQVMRLDARRLDEFFSFDQILLDAPCTGTGTISADERVRFSEGYLEKCVRLQRKLFEKAFRLLKKGGLLLYSTCSVLPEENGGILQTAQRLGATQLPVQLPSEIALLPSPEGTVCVCPSALYEGFFLSMFTK